MEEVDPDVVKKACNQVDSVLNASIPLLTRIKFPLVWERLSGGIRIQDLHEDKYIDTLEHIKNSYMVEEPLCKSLEILNDDESLKAFSQLIISRMHDTQSLIALKEDENKVIGCLIERVVDDINMKTASRMAIYEGSVLCKMQRLRKYILKQVNLKELFGTHRYNDIYIWSVEKEYRGYGIGKALMKAAIRQTKLFKIKVLGGIFTSNASQSMAKNMEFTSIFELLYASWIEEEEVVVINPGAKNYSANFLVIVFDDIIEEENEKINDNRKSGTSQERSVSSRNQGSTSN